MTLLFCVRKHLTEKRRKLCLRRRANVGEIPRRIRPPVEIQPMTGLLEVFENFGRDFELRRPQEPRVTLADFGNEDL